MANPNGKQNENFDDIMSIHGLNRLKLYLPNIAHWADILSPDFLPLVYQRMCRLDYQRCT